MGARPDKQPRRRYSDDDIKAFHLARLANRGNAQVAARACGVPRGSAQHLASRPVPPDVLASIPEFADRLQKIAEQAAGVVEGKLPLSSARDAAVVMGISIDKSQLLRGSPTAITEARRPLGLLTGTEEGRKLLASLASAIDRAQALAAQRQAQALAAQRQAALASDNKDRGAQVGNGRQPEAERGLSATPADPETEKPADNAGCSVR